MYGKGRFLWRFVLLLLCTVVIVGCLASDEDSSATTKAATTLTESCRADYTILEKPDKFMESTTPGVRVAVRQWIPEHEEDIQSVLVFHHGGAGWHSGYSEIMGRSMVEAGIAVIAYDTVGTGYSDAIQGHRQYFDSMETLANDLTLFVKHARETFPGKTVFCLGESFGGLVLLTQILKEQGNGEANLADGYLFAGPVVKVLPEMLPPTPVIAIVKFLARFFPMLEMPGSDFFSTFDLAFGDPGWAKAGRVDPFIQEAAKTPPRLGMAASVLSTMNYINDNLHQVQVPFKIFTGEKEMRVDTHAIQKLADLAQSKDKAIEIVPGAYHQLFQDTPEVTDLVCKHIQQWVLARS